MKNIIRRANHKRIDYGKALSLRIIKLLFDRPPQNTNSEPKEILILRLDGKLGDSIVCTGFLKSIRDSFPESSITVLCGHEATELYSNLDFINVIPTKKGFFPTIALWLRLQKSEYRVVINTSHILNSRALFIASRLKSGKKIGIKSQEYKTFCTSIEVDSNNEHITSRFEKICQELNALTTNLQYHVPVPQMIATNTRNFLQEHGIDTFVVLNSFAGARYRCFSKEKTFELVKLILDLFPHISVISIGNKGDLEILKKWTQEFSDTRWIINTNATSILENACLIELSSAVITPDTSIVHLACAYSKPLLAVYRPDSGLEKNSLIWSPINSTHKLIYSNHPPVGQEADISDFTINKELVSDFLNPIINETPADSKLSELA